MVEYSPHARYVRMPERHITEEQVEETLRIGKKSPGFRGRQLATAIIEGAEITVVFKEENDKKVVIIQHGEIHHGR